MCIRDRTEGEAFKKDNKIAEISASSQSILSGERTALNFLQMMSGISVSYTHLTLPTILRV